jgi:hypothetical protein
MSYAERELGWVFPTTAVAWVTEHIDTQRF